MSTFEIENDWLKKWALYSPKAVALQDADSGKQITYQQLLKQANALAQVLRDKYGVGHGDRVATLAMNEL
ncbi:MAG: long-chain fatty acid--CoA ligase, partial [Oligoflexia bacterium]|nr:long-chain fatty acid--CoA ligase [Oligoflexia bacterium]